MEGHTHQDPKKNDTSFDTCSASNEDWLDQNSSLPDLLLHTISPSLTGKNSNEAISLCKLLSPKPLIWQSRQEYIRLDQQRWDMHIKSILDKIPSTHDLPSLSMSPLQKDMCSLPLGGYFHYGLILENDLKLSTPTINPTILQLSFSGSIHKLRTMN